MIICICIMILLALMLAVSLYFNFKLGKIVFKMEDDISECLEELNQAYARIGRVLKFPVGSDDPFVQEVVDSLKMAQRAVLVVANRMVDGWKQLDERNPADSQKKNS